MRIKPLFILTLILLLSLLLGGCGPKQTPAPTETPTLIPTIAPTATPSEPLAILVIPADMDQAQSNLYQSTVYELAQAAGYHFQVRNNLAVADLDPSVKIVIAFPPDPGIAALAAAAPQVQFLAVDLPGVPAGGNVSVVSNASRPDLVGFFFGYVSALVTAEDDSRVGMIVPQDDPGAQQAFAAFKNGMKFYCGACPKMYYYQDIYGNDLVFPQLVEIPASAELYEYPAYGRLLKEKKVAMAYVYPSIATPELLNAIGSEGVITISDVTPNPRPLYWAASLQPDLAQAIRLAWAELFAGRGGQTFTAPFGLTNIDPNIITPGKQQLINQVLTDLLAGRIDIRTGQ